MSTYDYVVVGAGSAGCAVAARPAAASHTVLLIEAGGSDWPIPVRAPLAYGAQMGGPTDWAFESEPERGCDGRRIPQPRGKVLGGTSAMNAMVWVRGTRLDYDDWQLPGWLRPTAEIAPNLVFVSNCAQPWWPRYANP